MQSVNQGLQAAINTYASAALALAAQPVSGYNVNNSYALFIFSESTTDIYEGIDTLANHLASKVKAQISQLQTIEVYFHKVACWFTLFEYAFSTVFPMHVACLSGPQPTVLVFCRKLLH